MIDPPSDLTTSEETAESGQPVRWEPRHKSVEMERAYLRALIGPEFRPVLGMVGITVGIGTLFFRFIEGWSLIDALYFSVVTLATIGYGDLAPATRIGKLFTILYVFAGVGILGLFLSTVARSSTQRALKEHSELIVRADGGAENDD